MSGAMSQHVDTSDAPGLRVILVGKTGLDQALRKEPSIELARVGGLLDAVGEAASPMPGAPARCAVVVAGEQHPGAEAAELVAALRALDPGTAVLLVDDHPAERPGTGAYDVVVNPADGIERLTRLARRMLEAGSAAAPRAPSPRPYADRPAPLAPTARHSSTDTLSDPIATPPSGTPQPGREAGRAGPLATEGLGAMADEPAGGPAWGGEGDGSLVEAALAGRDLVVPAVELVRARTGIRGVRFVPGESAPPEGGTPVSHRGKVFGTLVGGPDAALRTPAAWLGRWLALGEQQAALRQAAMTDELTGAYNRRYFRRYLAAAIEQAQKDRVPVTLLLFDLDNFKKYNDRYGHAAGDEILRETVRLLRSTIRPGDRVCRIGGDEFAVVFYEPAGPRDPGSKPPEDVFQIAKRFQEQVRSHRFPKLGDLAPGALSVSGGLATFPWDGRSIDELMAHADALAMESKRAGKNAIFLGPHRPAGEDAPRA
jgi:diguanylate cyclase (GGDEF)-like protein